MTENNKAGNLIRKHRKDNKLTIEQLAEYCYVSDRCISDIERGITIPQADNLLEICRTLDIDIGELQELYIKTNETEDI